MRMHRRHAILALGSALLLPGTARAENKPLVTMYNDPSCGCCSGWLEHLTEAGFPTKAIEESRMDAVKQRLGVPHELWSCHTALIDGYVIEGHVPVAAIAKLLTERPVVKGLSAPGMPQGSPGMEAPDVEPEPYEIMSFGANGIAQFMRVKGDKPL